MKALDIMKRFVKDERGLETVEYAIVAGLIAAAAIGVLSLLGPEIARIFQIVVTALTAVV